MARIFQQGFELDGIAYGRRDNQMGEYDNMHWESKTESASYSSSYIGIEPYPRGGLGKACWRVYGKGTTGWYAKCFISATLPEYSSDELFMRFWLKPMSYCDEVLTLRTNADVVKFKINMTKLSETEYQLDYYNHDNTLIYSYKPLNFKEWIKVDFRILQATEGIVQLKLNDRLITTWSGNTLGTNGKISRVYFGKTGNQYTARDFCIDDIAINDASGIINNSWCGNGSIVCIHPYANGSINQFTPMEGTQNFENVDETSSDGDATYNSSYALEDTDLFKFKIDGIDEQTVINAVSVITQAKFLEQPLNMAHVISIDGVTEELSNFKLQNGYVNQSSCTDVNPKTNGKFTVGEFNNSLEIGYRTKDYVE